MSKFRKRPVVVEAVENKGEWKPIVEWLQSLAGSYFAFQPGTNPPVTRNDDGSLNVRTLEGIMRDDERIKLSGNYEHEIKEQKP